MPSRSLYPTNDRNLHWKRNWQHFLDLFPPLRLFNQPRPTTSHVFLFGKTRKGKLKSMYPSVHFLGSTLKRLASAPLVSPLEQWITFLANLRRFSLVLEETDLGTTSSGAEIAKQALPLFSTNCPHSFVTSSLRPFLPVKFHPSSGISSHETRLSSV